MSSFALNKKKGVSRLMVVLLSLALLLSIVPILSVDAAVKGSLTFYHGINQSQKYTYGRTQSTAVENSMHFVGYIDYFSGPKNGLREVDVSPVYENVAGVQRNLFPGSVLGASLFEYYVDNTWQHTSTDWWDFDFR